MLKGIENIYAHGAKCSVVSLRGKTISQITYYLLNSETTQYDIIAMIAGYNNLRDDNYEKELKDLKSTVSIAIF
jgi:hypothetical protein